MLTGNNVKIKHLITTIGFVVAHTFVACEQQPKKIPATPENLQESQMKFNNDLAQARKKHDATIMHNRKMNDEFLKKMDSSFATIVEAMETSSSDYMALLDEHSKRIASNQNPATGQSN